MCTLHVTAQPKRWMRETERGDNSPKGGGNELLQMQTGANLRQNYYRTDNIRLQRLFTFRYFDPRVEDIKK
jgi:hypothetical protein